MRRRPRRAAPPPSPTDARGVIGSSTPIRVLLVDDQQLVRTGFRMILADEPDIVVVGEAPDGRVAIDAAGRLTPDVVVMDVRMPVLDGVEATRMLCARDAAGRPRVLVLTTFDADEYVVEALRAGASGSRCSAAAWRLARRGTGSAWPPACPSTPRGRPRDAHWPRRAPVP